MQDAEWKQLVLDSVRKDGSTLGRLLSEGWNLPERAFLALCTGYPGDFGQPLQNELSGVLGYERQQINPSSWETVSWPRFPDTDACLMWIAIVTDDGEVIAANDQHGPIMLSGLALAVHREARKEWWQVTDD